MAQSDKNRQGEPSPLPRRNRPEAVARDAGRLADSAFARKGFADPTLVLRWEEIVGAEVARLAVPLRLSQNAGGGVLTLKAEPGASTFLQHESRSLCARINAYLGRPAVQRLRFVQGVVARHRQTPSALRPGGVAGKDPALGFKGGETLRAALLSLARWRQAPYD